MTQDDTRQRYHVLQNLIQSLDQAYHGPSDAPTPVMSDASCDALMRETLKLERWHPALKAELQEQGKTSVTERVGSAALTGTKTTHESRMLSLGNTFDKDDLRDWGHRLARSVERPLPGLRFVTEPKFDGLSVNLRYENGQFVSASTRGNGKIGEVVTANLLASRLLGRAGPDSGSFPARLKGDRSKLQGVLEVRGEVYMKKSDLALYNAEAAEQGEPMLMNTRNGANGGLRQKNPEKAANRRLSVALYGVGKTAGLNFETQTAVLGWLRIQGFAVSSENSGPLDLDEAYAARNALEARKDTLDYDIDGVVFKLN